MIHASLFSGIGGPEIAAAMMGWDNAFHCEINPFGRAVLDYWFPDSTSYGDITTTDFKEWRGKIDILTGGFPCQPFSYAGKRGGERTSVTSGRKCSALLTKSGPLGSLVKTLLESPLWSKAGGSLTWDAKPLYSERVTLFTDTNSAKPSPLNGSAETLNTSDIPSSRLLFRLRVSMLPTAGTACSSSPMMKTPCSWDAKEGMQSWDTSRDRGTLGQQAAAGKLDYLLPTPTARDEKNPSSPDGERIARKVDQRYTIELNDLAAMGMLPTPQAGEANHYRNKFIPGSQMETSLSAMAGSGLLPTPTANDAPNSTLPASQQERNDSIVKRLITKQLPPL